MMDSDSRRGIRASPLISPKQNVKHKRMDSQYDSEAGSYCKAGICDGAGYPGLVEMGRRYARLGANTDTLGTFVWYC